MYGVLLLLMFTQGFPELNLHFPLQKRFRGRLHIPFYLLLWRDTHSGVYAIQEEAPYDGTEQEKNAYVARWQAIVDDAIQDKHKQVRDLPRKH